MVVNATVMKAATFMKQLAEVPGQTIDAPVIVP
jgi:hypothetical protein